MDADQKFLNSIIIEAVIDPEKPDIFGQNKICEGEALILSSDPINGAEYIWITPKGQVRTDQPILDIDNTGQNDAGIYALYIQLGSCRSPVSDIFNIQVIHQPEAPVFLSDTLAFCLDSNASIEQCLEVSQLSGDENFILINSQNGQVLLEQEQPCFDLSFLNSDFARSYDLIAVIELENCRSEFSNNFHLTFEELPETGAQSISSSYVVCGNTFETIEINNPLFLDVRYSSPDSDLVFIENGNELSVSDLKAGTNEIIVTSSFAQCIDFFQGYNPNYSHRRTNCQ